MTRLIVAAFGLAFVLIAGLTSDATAAPDIHWAIRRTLPEPLPTASYAVSPTAAPALVHATRLAIYRSVSDSSNNLLGYDAVVWGYTGIVAAPIGSYTVVPLPATGTRVYFKKESIDPNAYGFDINRYNASPSSGWIDVPIDPLASGSYVYRNMYRELVKYDNAATALCLAKDLCIWGYFSEGGLTYVETSENYQDTWGAQDPGEWRVFETCQVLFGLCNCSNGWYCYNLMPVT